jgi:tripartite-type tricarboxylate transporter receptor subunit TctC
MKPIPLRSIVACCLALSAAATPSFAQTADAAASFPNKPIRLVVPFAAGGTSDVLARAVGVKLGEVLGQSIVVDNRPGANGNIGSDAVAKAAPDGYTLLLAADGTMVINPALYPKLSFDPERDFIALTRVALVPLVFVATPSLKANSVKELIELSKQPGTQLDFSSAGVGSAGHLAGELFKVQTGARMTHVPYKGGGQAITDVVAGQVPMIVTAFATAGPFIKNGKLKALGVTSAQRFAGSPSVPTVAEAGVTGFDVSSWYGVMAPANTPDAVVNKLHAALSKVLQTPEMKTRLEDLGALPVLDTRAQFAQLIHADLTRWARIVKEAKVSLD